jgi:hypothetical protein
LHRHDDDALRRNQERDAIERMVQQRTGVEQCGVLLRPGVAVEAGHQRAQPDAFAARQHDGPERVVASGVDVDGTWCGLDGRRLRVDMRFDRCQR